MAGGGWWPILHHIRLDQFSPCTMAREKNGNTSNFFFLPFQMKESFKLGSKAPPRSSSGSTSFTEFGDPETELDSIKYEEEYEEDSFDEELRFSDCNIQVMKTMFVCQVPCR